LPAFVDHLASISAGVLQELRVLSPANALPHQLIATSSSNSHSTSRWWQKQPVQRLL
jgi:hypothetical protein